MRAVVVGAGPAGAALGLLLARRGVEVALLERQTDFAREFRGEGLMPSGVDALEQMGLGEELRALPSSKIERAKLYQDGRELLEVPLGGGGPIFVSQPALLEMLVAQSQKLAGFRIERGFTVRDLLRRDGRVLGVRGDGPDGPSEVAADFTIGADGRASVVRKRSGLDRPGPTESFDVVWGKLPLPPFMGAGGAVRLYLGRAHFCICFPAPDGRLQFGWVIEKGAFGALRRRGVDDWVDALAAHVSPDLAAHFRAHRSALTQPFLLDVVCHHLERWSEPGLLLLGDAAHPMSPVGAQGINLALRDALVASNHLGPALAAGAPPADLDAAARRVCEERLPEIRAIQRLQRLAPRFAFQRTRWSRFLLRTVAPLLVRSGLAPRLVGPFARRITRGTAPLHLD